METYYNPEDLAKFGSVERHLQHRQEKNSLNITTQSLPKVLLPPEKNPS